MKTEKTDEYHVKSWYKENWHVNPERVPDNGVIEKINPYYRSGPRMKLYPESKIKFGLEQNPKLLIKPRTAKQIEASRSNVRVLVERAQDLVHARDLMNHANYHDENGLHKHDERDLYNMRHRASEIREKWRCER